MEISPANRIFCSILLLCAAACVMQPVAAESGTFTIAYRGSGGGYIGDTVVFDGRNTYGNTTLIRVTGPGLPAEGVSPNNLNGPTGSATPVSVDQYGTWKFVWFSSLVPGIDKLHTAKYTFTASDSGNPKITATAAFMLKKREYSIKASPGTVTSGGYINLIGYTEEDITSIKIAVANASGNILYSAESPVSSSGYFNYGFHADLAPGVYRVTVSSPAMKVPFGTAFTVTSGEETLPVSTGPTPFPAVTPAGSSPGATTVPGPSPTRSPAGPGPVLVALVAGAGIFSLLWRE